MGFLSNICILLITIKHTIGIGEQQCLSSNSSNQNKMCRDFETMSVLVADLVGRSVKSDGDDKNPAVSPFNISIKTLIRASSAVVGRNVNALKTVVVNGLVLLTQTIVTMMTDRQETNEYVSGGRPIDWISNNPYIKSLTGEAIDDTLADRLETSAAGLPCVQLLVCRLSPVVQYMQRLVKSGRLKASWTASDWRRLGGGGCVKRFVDCAKTVECEPAAGST